MMTKCEIQAALLSGKTIVKDGSLMHCVNIKNGQIVGYTTYTQYGNQMNFKRRVTI